MSRPLRVYIAGPLTAPTLRQVCDHIEKAEDAAAQVIAVGHYPFVPHHSWSVDLKHTQRTGEQLTHQWWVEWCYVWLDHCDVVYQIGSSPGADMERAYAEAKGIPVVTTIVQLLKVAQDIAA